MFRAMVFDPASVGLTASSNLPMEAASTLSVTVTPPVGAAELRNTFPLASRCWPIVNKLAIDKEFIATVAVTVADVYPVALAVMLAEPTPTAWNDVDAEDDPPAITTGDVLMVPTLGVSLVTLALMDSSPATASTTKPLA